MNLSANTVRAQKKWCEHGANMVRTLVTTKSGANMVRTGCSHHFVSTYFEDMRMTLGVTLQTTANRV